MAFIYCPNCNNICADTDSFCTHCGFSLAVHRMPSVKQCPECTATNDISQPSCVKCGYPFEVSNQNIQYLTPPVQQRNNDKTGLAIVIIAAAFIVIVGGYFAYEKYQEYLVSKYYEETNAPMTEDVDTSPDAAFEASEKDEAVAVEAIPAEAVNEADVSEDLEIGNLNEVSKDQAVSANNSSSIESNSNNNGLKQLLLNFYQSLKNNTFDANNYFAKEVKQYQSYEDITPNQINRDYQSEIRLKTNLNIEIVNDLINFKEKNGNIYSYTFPVNMSFINKELEFYDTKEYVKEIRKGSVQVGYDMQQRKIVAYKTSWLDFNFEIHGKKYSSEGKHIKSRITNILDNNYKTRNMGTGYLVTFDAFSKPEELPADYKPVVGDIYVFSVYSWEEKPYSRFFGFKPEKSRR